jgi:hypothetical protein
METKKQHGQKVFNAINNFADELEIYHWNDVTHEIHCPTAISSLTSVA